ncbi:hypothetical protein V6N13_051944 [Hibiscus sabdariffa]|uniref:Tetratricopeptide repeat protein n=1 Tax=Hibiscus sabdariffa TaxID=183260 RepID=A0ABR2T5L4_9ROSI
MITQEIAFVEEKEGEKTQDPKPKQTLSLSEFLESNDELAEELKSYIYQKIENHEDEEALSILNSLISAQPNVTHWKFLFGRLLGDMGQTEKARKVFEEILQSNPFSYETLFENALLMDRCGYAGYGAFSSGYGEDESGDSMVAEDEGWGSGIKG